MKLSPSGLGLLTDGTKDILWIALVVLFVFQTSQIWKVNKENLTHGVPEYEKYRFKQVAILDLSYFVTFGSRAGRGIHAAAVLPGNLPGLDPVKAGLLARFTFMNLVARPGGGHFSDKFDRRNTLMVLIAGLGLAVGYFVLSQIDSSWWISMAVIATMACSFFVQAGEGAVFVVVPLVKSVA